MNVARSSLLGVLACAMVGCGGEEPTPPMGDVSIEFEVSNTVRSSRNLVDNLAGNIYGELFVGEEVTLTGPVDDAKELGQTIELVDVNLEADGSTSMRWKSGQLPPGRYIFLGFYDVDGNGAVAKDPDPGDPVTLPSNRFEIFEGVTTPHVVTFDLVFN